MKKYSSIQSTYNMLYKENNKKYFIETRTDTDYDDIEVGDEQLENHYLGDFHHAKELIARTILEEKHNLKTWEEWDKWAENCPNFNEVVEKIIDKLKLLKVTVKLCNE